MMATPADLDPRITDRLRASAEWRLLGRLFECPSPAWRTDVDALARELAPGELRTAAEEACAGASEGVFHAVFGPGGPAPPREVSYHDTLELGTLLSDLTSQYDAFDYRPSTTEAPDHVAVEIGFVAYLHLKEAFAIAIGDGEAAGLTARTAERFEHDHLGMMAEPLAALLAGSNVPYLARASALLASRVGPRPRPPGVLPVIQIAPDDDDEGGMSCAS
jgi:nitrate reductase assembly molybdenum cofactor insertion protein NarJ